MLRIGLTGGIASGKSTVADLFAERGVPVVDTDLLAREVVVPGSPGLEALTAELGPAILAADGTLDRRRLRARVFADRQLRGRVEAILHPLIRARTLARLAEIDAPYAVVVVPLLVETDFGKLVDRVLVVDCALDQQVARVVARDRVTPAEARATLAAQSDRAGRLAAADDVIDNSGPLAATRARVDELHASYAELAQHCRSRPGRAK